MLPDYLAVKQKAENKLTASMQVRVGSEGLLSMVTHQRLHEGRGFILYRSDGTVQESEFQKHEAMFEISASALEESGFKAVQTAMASAVEQLAEAGHKMIFEGLAEATADRAIDAKGRPFTAELYLDGLETLEFAFDDDGKWELPTLAVGPGMAARAAEQLRRLDEEEPLKNRLAEIVSRNKEEWRDREANRKLVD